MSIFNSKIYRAYNSDLSNLDDDSLKNHFDKSQNEPRIFGSVEGDVELLSMRWLRGQGVEIGAGSSPTKLFGRASTLLVDCDPDLSFGGSYADIKPSIDDHHFIDAFDQRFDFAIASHVLEHADSFIRALCNLINIVKEGGIVYLVLPDKECLKDVTYIPDYEFNHHILEYSDSLVFAKEHDDAFIKANGSGLEHINIHANLTPEYISEVRSGKISQAKRFMFHKHNYNFIGWVHVILNAQNFLNHSFECIDLRYGHFRKDCHFILRKLAEAKANNE